MNGGDSGGTAEPKASALGGGGEKKRPGGLLAAQSGHPPRGPRVLFGRQAQTAGREGESLAAEGARLAG